MDKTDSEASKYCPLARISHTSRGIQEKEHPVQNVDAIMDRLVLRKVRDQVIHTNLYVYRDRRRRAAIDDVYKPACLVCCQ